ncbi:MAG: IS30 family transposase [Candidatus Endobugula sp.]|jgi:IS30 family transposase
MVLSNSTVSNELKRNKGLRGYRPKQAQEKAKLRDQIKSRYKKLTAAV